MTPEQLMESLTLAGIEELPTGLGGGYRCAAWLRDGTYLPCVLVKRIGPFADLIRQMIDDELRGEGSYKYTQNPVRESLKTQFTGSNLVTRYIIDRVEPSRFAIPISLLEQVSGETAMSLWLFALETPDGRSISFSGSHLLDMLFFDLPSNIEFSDFTKVHNVGSGRRRNLPRGRNIAQPCAARPFFTCFVDDEPFVTDLSSLGVE